MGNPKELTNQELREKAVDILYTTLRQKYESITREECYQLYDKMQEVNRQSQTGEREDEW